MMIVPIIINHTKIGEIKILNIGYHDVGTACQYRVTATMPDKHDEVVTWCVHEQEESAYRLIKVACEAVIERIEE